MIDPSISTLARWCRKQGFVKMEIIYDLEHFWSGKITKRYPKNDAPGTVLIVSVKHATTEAILVCDLYTFACRKFLGRTDV